MANKKSLDAKAYINGKVNDMREQFVKVTDKWAKKQLVETFKKTTSSDEYQENLAIVNEDTDVIRKYAKRKKWWDITSEEFKDAKTEFYGKDMNLNLWEDFEKLSKDEQCKYIIDKFWYTQYSFDCLIRYDLVGKINNEDRGNFSNLNNSSAQYLLRQDDYEFQILFFEHIWSFWELNEETLNLIIKEIIWINHMSWVFSEKNTKYILDNIDGDRLFGGVSELDMKILIAHRKFSFWKWKDTEKSMINYLYRRLGEYRSVLSKWILFDSINEVKDRKNKKSLETYKITPNNIRLTKIIKKCSPSFANDCDKILLLDAVWNNKDVLGWYIRHYNHFAICSRLDRNVADPQYKNIWISEDMLLQAQKRLQSMNEK